MPPLRGREAAAVLAADPGIAQITGEERDALRTYSSNWFWLVQNVLWRTREASEYGQIELGFVWSVVDRMDAALARLDGPEHDVVVYHAGPLPPSDGVMHGYVARRSMPALLRHPRTCGRYSSPRIVECCCFRRPMQRTCPTNRKC